MPVRTLSFIIKNMLAAMPPPFSHYRQTPAEKIAKWLLMSAACKDILPGSLFRKLGMCSSAVSTRLLLWIFD